MADESPNIEAPAPLTDAYHKARRNLMLFSAILLAWEYVGISIGDPDSGEVAAKAPIGGMAITLQNPEVIPVIIVLLVLYFGHRLLIEWYQCDRARRAGRAPRLDLTVSMGLAGSALILFAVQQASQFRLADMLDSPRYMIGFLTIVPSAVVSYNIFFLIAYARGKSLHTFYQDTPFGAHIITIVMYIFLAFLFFLGYREGELLSPFVGSFLGAGLAATARFRLWRFRALSR